jgi:hypothetical protein
MEMICGLYKDSKLGKNLVVKTNYVDAYEDDFEKSMTAKVIYAYEDGTDRSEYTKTFLDYAEINLELIEKHESGRPTTIAINDPK